VRRGGEREVSAVTLLAEGGAWPRILPAEAERDWVATAVWHAQTRAVGSGVRLRTGCQDGGHHFMERARCAAVSTRRGAWRQVEAAL
jgi:hypothetical protein